MQKQKKKLLKFLPSHMPAFSLARMELLEDFLNESSPRRVPWTLYTTSGSIDKLGVSVVCACVIFTLLFIFYGLFPIWVLYIMAAIAVAIIWVAKRELHILSRGDLYSANVCNIIPVKTRSGGGRSHSGHHFPSEERITGYNVEMEFTDDYNNVIHVKDTVSPEVGNHLLYNSVLKNVDIIYSPRYRRRCIIVLKYILDPPAV